jgi:hypothetical protein
VVPCQLKIWRKNCTATTESGARANKKPEKKKIGENCGATTDPLPKQKLFGISTEADTDTAHRSTGPARRSRTELIKKSGQIEEAETAAEHSKKYKQYKNQLELN